jgi:hypothetical protein
MLANGDNESMKHLALDGMETTVLQRIVLDRGPAQKIDQRLGDGFMQGSSAGAAAYGDARGKYMLFKAAAQATMVRLLPVERRRLSG